MSAQPEPAPKLSWDRRPVTAHDMVIIAGIMLVACLGSVYLMLYTFSPGAGSESGEQTAAESVEEGGTSSDVSGIVEEVVQAAGSGSAGETIFQQQCVACHTVGGGTLVGPDLAGVVDRRDRDWLTRWIATPDEMLAAGDPIAAGLLEEFNNVPMPNLGLTAAQVEDVIAYLSNAAGGSAEAAAATLPAGDAAGGRALFTGALALQNGGPPCMSCHTTANAGPLGGGTLGPDLTQVYQRYGEVGLAATLQNLPFPTMQGVFGKRPLTEQEAADLYAYFAQTNQSSPSAADYIFVAAGLVIFLLLLLAGALIWRRRLIAVRKPLLGGAR